MVKDSSVVLRRFVLNALPVLERFPVDQQYSEPRRARWWVHTRESVQERI